MALAIYCFALSRAVAGDGNRLTYLDEVNPYYPHRNFAKLTTPMWCPEEGVEAVVILAIDDMRGHEKWEQFLRPILNRLKKIDGRAPVSIMTCSIDPYHPHLQTWLKEGLSIEVHTVDHPCPLLQGGDLAKAKSTYDRCLDLMNIIPNNKPVAFRMPCCDSLNTLSPRFFTEIFNKTSPHGNFLQIDSSVFNVFTSNDPSLPRELVIDADARDKFRKYVPYDRSFVNTIEDYPYPYAIGNLCWEFPCVTPSDWAAQHLHQSNNPTTVQDWKAALDATVIKQGVFCLVFHPHGWIRSEQIVDLIDYAATKHGKKVKFLNFKEALERLTMNALHLRPLRTETGKDNGVRVLDVDNDGFMDVIAGQPAQWRTFLWSAQTRSWNEKEFPFPKRDDGPRHISAARFGVVRPSGMASFIYSFSQRPAGAMHFDGKEWIEGNLLTLVMTERKSRETLDALLANGGFRFRDLDDDGVCELLVSNSRARAILQWSNENMSWSKLPFTLPEDANYFGAPGESPAFRFADIDEDGHDDIVVSNEAGFGVHLFESMQKGWSKKALAGSPGAVGALPLISRSNTNNGMWVHSRHLWWQNEDTALLPNLVDRRSFNQLLENVEPTAKTPQASLKCLQPRPGFQAELLVSEPLVQSPINFAWGPDGKLWVVEMGDYPLGLDGKGKPGGRIKYLESTKGDGKYDKATVFLDGLSFPTTVLPWRKGVLVTCAPDIFYAEDTTGSGKADKREVLFTGFVPGNPQHRVNSLVWGLDNWIYCANGDSGGRIKSMKTGKEVDIRGRDLRIRPDTGDLEATTGQTQYGLSRDDWGNWFGNNNSNPMYHFVLADHYLKRNPHFAPPDPRVPVSVTPGAARVYPISRTLPRFNDPHGANHFTSACSAIVYRDDLFGPHFANNAFVSEPVHDLVHREIMTPKGPTFTSSRAVDEQTSEFLASSDNWFRPTTIQTGPDGALWIADMYRYVIEHPQWIPLEWQKRLDLRAGADMGRIYRVFPVGKQPRSIPRLDKLDTAGLVAALDSPNGWQRDTAQQMLLWHGDKAAIPLLEKMQTESANPLARLHALCALDGLNAIRIMILQRGLEDKHPGVRRNAVRIAERFSSEFESWKPLTDLVDDIDPQVRMQLAYSLGAWGVPQVGPALGRLALRDGGDRFHLAAILSSVNKKNLGPMLTAVLEGSKSAQPPADLLASLLRMASAFGDTKVFVQLLDTLATPVNGEFTIWQFAALAGMLEALGQRNSSLEKMAAESDEIKQLVQRLEPLFAAARKLALNREAPPADRAAAVPLLGRGPDHQQEDLQKLAEMLVPQTPDIIQAAIVANLGSSQQSQAAELLLRGWKSYAPALRNQILDMLLRREEWVKASLEALERGQILPQDIDAARRQRLLEHKSTDIRDRAKKLLATSINADRQQVIDAYKSVLTTKGDAARGKQIFAKTCAACHKFDGVGNVVGPDLASLGDKSPEALLIALLDPNRAVEARYVSYVASTKNGLILTGVLTSETATSITLTGQDGKAQTILRTNLEELRSSGKSLMPEGLEKDLKDTDITDVIAHLRGPSGPRQRRVFEGNKPELVKPADDGTLHLLPGNCEIFGTTILLEKQYGNLGYWNSEDDQAVWKVENAKPAKYTVWLNWACANNNAGNTFWLSAGESQLRAKVTGTGSWDVYRWAKVGEITLPAGKQEISLQAAGKINGAMIDLKAIKLVPMSP
jgi:putative membrane-bound dehydrogenase-like protein